MREITTRPTHCAVVEEPAAAWRALWRRSRSPRWAMFLRLYLAGTLLLFALVTAASGPSLSALLAGAAAIFFGTPTVIRGLLAPLERRVLAASRSEASDLLGELRQRKLVKLFAPFAWQSVQEARLHLRRGDGKAAVKALAETARQSIGGEQSPVLLSARGYAHLLAGEPDEAARLLRARAEQGALTPVDRLHLGLASLLSKGGSRSELDRAREHLEAAREAFGGQPQVLAGLALAHQRLGDADAAASALESAELSLGEGDVDDPLAGDLIKRARKALRSYLRSQQKRSRRRGRRSGEVEVDVSEEGDPGSDDAPVEAAKPAQVPHTQDTPPRVEAVVAARVEAVVAAPSEAPAQAKSERADPPKKKDKKEKKPRGKRARKQARREAKRKAKREAKLEGRVDEAATTQTAEPASADARASERSREAAVAATSSASSEASASVPSSAASAALASERVAISSASSASAAGATKVSPASAAASSGAHAKERIGARAAHELPSASASTSHARSARSPSVSSSEARPVDVRPSASVAAPVASTQAEGSPSSSASGSGRVASAVDEPSSTAAAKAGAPGITPAARPGASGFTKTLAGIVPESGQRGESSRGVAAPGQARRPVAPPSLESLFGGPSSSARPGAPRQPLPTRAAGSDGGRASPPVIAPLPVRDAPPRVAATRAAPLPTRAGTDVGRPAPAVAPLPVRDASSRAATRPAPVVAPLPVRDAPPRAASPAASGASKAPAANAPAITPVVAAPPAVAPPRVAPMVAPPSVKVPAAPRVAAPKIPVVTAPQLGAPKVPGVGAPIVTAPVIGAAPSAAPAFPQFELDDWDAALDGLEMEERVEVGGP